MPEDLFSLFASSFVRCLALAKAGGRQLVQNDGTVTRQYERSLPTITVCEASFTDQRTTYLYSFRYNVIEFDIACRQLEIIIPVFLYAGDNLDYFLCRNRKATYYLQKQI